MCWLVEGLEVCWLVEGVEVCWLHLITTVVKECCDSSFLITPPWLQIT